MATDSGAESLLGYFRNESGELADHLGEYGYLIADVLWVIALGVLAVFVLHRLASRFLYSLVSNNRVVRVIFGALYVLVLVVAVLGALRKLGLEIDTIGSLAVLAVLVGAILVYFLIPFLPRLPFVVGHTIETNGVMGTVDQVSSFHTTIRKFDGTMVFLPNALVMASKILNYSYTPSRRIEMEVNLPRAEDAEAIRTRVLEVLRADERVLDEPAPPAAFVMSANAAAVMMTVYCWVRNEDFLAARSDLWLKLTSGDSRVPLALPRQAVEVTGTAPDTGAGDG